MSDASAIERVVLVGHCVPDSFLLKQTAANAFPDAEVSFVNDENELADHAHGNAVWLVNRALDGAFRAADGVELIRQHAGGENGPRAMLVSNFADAQTRAEEAGAYPGFGKNDLGSDAARQCLRRAGP